MVYAIQYREYAILYRGQKCIVWHTEVYGLEYKSVFLGIHKRMKWITGSVCNTIQKAYAIQYREYVILYRVYEISYRGRHAVGASSQYIMLNFCPPCLLGG
jgi:hypothetical protein